MNTVASHSALHGQPSQFLVTMICVSLVPRPFPPPVFDRLQYANIVSDQILEVGMAWGRG